MSNTPSRRQALKYAGILAGAYAVGSIGGARASSVLRIGYQKFNTLNILKGTGNLEKALSARGITVEWKEFASAPLVYEAINTGNIDIGHAADANTVFAQASGINFVYLAVEVPNPRGLAWIVRKNSPFQSVADLKGRTIVTGRGWTPQYLLVRALTEKGLTFKDIDPVYVAVVGDARLAFQSGKAEAIGLWDPFLAGAELDEDVRVLRNAEGLMSNRTVYVGRPDYVAANEVVLKTVFTELRKSQDWARANTAAVAKIFSEQLNIPEKVLYRASERRNYGVEPVTSAVIAEQQSIADGFFGLDLIAKPVKVSEAKFADSGKFL